MDTGNFVSPGDTWHPESAARYNGVSDMLNGLGVIGPSGQRFSAGESAVITCRNTGNTLLRTGSYVTVSENGTAMTAGFDDPCGVLLEDCPPGNSAAVQLAGLAQVAADFPRPPGILRLSPACVLLNSVGHDLYRNYFKVAATGYSDRGVITGVRIFDGGDPESTSAGLTDVGDVPVTTLAGTFQDGTLFFVRLTVPDTPPPSSGTNFYTHTFFTASRTNFPNAWEPVVLLAEVVGGQIVQRWTGGMIYWRSRFIIGFGREYNL
ncbi:MAG: hypothetical protein IJS01_10230 [Lentisphaeria bacterium]|nr:hypothetical protein [Lentisphaeria bacterium]